MNIQGIAINADAGLIDGDLEVLGRELDYYRDIGFTHVELSPHGVGAIRGGVLNQERLRELKTLLARYPFRYAVHGPNPLNLMNADPDTLDRPAFIASLEFTAALDAEVMVYHAGRYLAEEDFLLSPQPYPHEEDFLLSPQPYPHAEKREVLWEREKALLYQMGEIAARHGVTIAVENARPYLNAPGYCYGESLVLLARMIREVGHCSVGATLDIGHAYLAARRYGWNLYDGVEAVAPLVRHIHLHDNFGRCSASYERKQYEMAAMGRGDMHMPIGWGEIPVWPILQLLPRYSGLVTLELRPRYRDKYREALAAARAMFKPANERHAS